MSGFNGSGTFVISGSGLPYVAGTTISSTVSNTLDSDLATGLSTAICKDGQTTITANLPMGGFKHTGAGVASAAGQYVTYQQWQLTRFAAYNSATQSNVTGDGTLYAVSFDTADFNVGSAFSTVTALFTAPVAGQLQVSGRVQVSDLTNAFTEAYCEVQTSGGRHYVSNDQNTINLASTNQLSLSISDTIPLGAGETAQFNVRVVGGAKVVDVIGSAGFTRFSGVFYPTV